MGIVKESAEVPLTLVDPEAIPGVGFLRSTDHSGPKLSVRVAATANPQGTQKIKRFRSRIFYPLVAGGSSRELGSANDALKFDWFD
jgi:hypothetical protein